MKALVPIVIFFFGFLVRVYGFNFGLPAMLVHSDENEYVASVKAVVDHLPSPYQTGFPKSSFYYSLLGVYAFFRKFISGETDIAAFFPIGRIFSAVLGTLSLVFVYKMARSLLGRRMAIWTALFFAFSLIDVQIAHYIKEDVYIQFFGTASLMFLAFSFKRSHVIWNLLLSIIFAVLAGSAKINGFFYAIPVGYYLAFSWPIKLDSKKLLLLILVAASVFAFYINTPISFMDSEAGKKYSLSALLSPEHDHLVMSTNQDGMPNYLFWSKYLVGTGLGYFLSLLTFLGIIDLFFNNKKMISRLMPYWSLIAFSFLVFVFQTQRFDRWICLVTPVLAILGAFGAEMLIKRLKMIGWWIVGYGFLICAVVCLYFGWSLAQRDARYSMLDFMERYRDGGTILFLPGLDPPKHELVKRGFEVLDISCPPATAERYAGMYLVVNQTLFDIYRRFPNSPLYKTQVDCLDKLLSGSEYLAEFSNDSDLKTKLFGDDKLIGPATIRYLHFPKTRLYKISDKQRMVLYQYSETDLLIIEKTYVALPVGKYKVEVDFQYGRLEKQTKVGLKVGAKSESLGKIRLEKIVDYNPRMVGVKQRLDYYFELDKSARVQLLIEGADSLKVNAIEISSADD